MPGRSWAMSASWAEASSCKRCLAGKGFGLGTLIERVAENLGLAAAGLQSACKQRAAVRGRAIVCGPAMDDLSISGRELSQRLRVSPAAVSKLAQRGRKDPRTETPAKALFGTQA